MLINGLILSIVLLSALALLSPGVANAKYWRATVTPLASIIGSGFLVLGPILDAAYGQYAPLIMAVLCGAAYAFGTAIRFNMRYEEERGGNHRPIVERLEAVSSWALAFAYIISVAYYLNLFGAFGIRLTESNTSLDARLLTSAVFLFILIVGWMRGFGALERLEEISVSVKLAIICGLLAGLAVYFGKKIATGDLVHNPAEVAGWQAVTLAFGLIVTVQGFETSRYLGDAYSARMRVRSMRLAQWISTAIYIIYIVLLTYVFPRGALSFSETAIIDMMIIVAPILPTLLVAAALSAQFSAAVADTAGAGGLFSELTKKRLLPKHAYVALVIVGLLLTWTANIFDIISYASKAFAVYYGLQAAIAATSAWTQRLRGNAICFSLLALLGALIAIFGVPVEH